MCGINGIIQFNHKRTAGDLRNIVHDMNERIIHRGPDDEGLFADEFCSLGMRRLSIIDLAGGNQPIWNPDHTKVIVYNGEIYNFKVLREELIKAGYSFRTNSDTEVILLGYEEYGVEILNKLEGMFAFVIYDLNEKKWILARDRTGEKPLYYHIDPEKAIFASELKSITATGLVKKEIDTTALSQYFQLTYIPAPLTIFTGIRKLPPGHYMVIDADGGSEIKQYWHLNSEIDPSIGYEEYKQKLREALISSVERRMISDVPIGAFLSGGFDSSIVVGIMSLLSPGKVNTFTVSFDDKIYDESKLAELVAKKNNTIHTVLKISEEEILGNIPDLLGNIDEPFADSSLIAVNAISKKAREYVKVVLTGDGGDELFAGYNKYLLPYYGKRYKKIPKFLRKGVIEKSLNLLPSKSYRVMGIRKVINACGLDEVEQIRYMMSLGFKPDELKELIPGIDTETMDFISEQYAFLSSADAQTRTQYVDVKTVLEGDMLPKVDRASMFASLETRVPMLDSKVIELAFDTPTEYKIKGKNRKIILKDTFRDLLPDELFRAPKHGFGVPVSDWLENSLKDQLLKYSDEEFLRSQGLFSADYIGKVIEQHMTHQIDRFSTLWSFYVFQNWYEREMM